jgi:hypothetical protein
MVGVWMAPVTAQVTITLRWRLRLTGDVLMVCAPALN